ncbi:glycosyltransferase family 2 protein [Agromyces sp. PvR057]|uniref:glycosyltransferase family 2 protein n=1 Tax=Agromyces sp. PvR057 TaxID=3156403 RepID=UPI0033932F6A
MHGTDPETDIGERLVEGRPDPLVTVVIAAFNAERVIEEALKSLSDQTYGNWEAIVVDDGSVDQTGSVVTKLAANEPRIRLLKLATNGGPARARNEGISIARGDWIAVLDADDTWLPERLRRIVDAAFAHQADIVADQILLRRLGSISGRESAWRWLGEEQRISLRQLVWRDLPGTGRPIGWAHPMFSRRLIASLGVRYDERERYGEDWLLLFRAVSRGAKMWLIPTAGYVYTVRASNSASQTTPDFASLARISAALGGDRLLRMDIRLLLRFRARLYLALMVRDSFLDAVHRRRIASAASILIRRPALVPLLWRQWRSRERHAMHSPRSEAS